MGHHDEDAVATPSPRTKPFLKWAGGKSALLPTLRKCFPPRFNKYVEPFVGGGALFFDLAPDAALLADSNAELVNCYRVVKTRAKQLIEILQDVPVSSVEYYEIRQLDPNELDSLSRAARLIYLNKTCFNGLYRVNRFGQFNTPYGGARVVNVVDEVTILRASRALQRATIACGDFYDLLLDTAERGDFVYLDPPYLPVSQYADFKRYTKEQFGVEDHIRLAEMLALLTARGCFVLLSNSYTEFIANLYKEFWQVTVYAPRAINCKVGGRGIVRELLIANYDISRMTV
ncbi:DNA adenine methylase [candidate division KSB1 bacterium]|nr:DNA adenine methylase [candidate division KSB1 bacterium]